MSDNQPVVTLDDSSIKDVLKQKLPVVLFLFNGSHESDKPLQDAVQRAAKKYSDTLVFGCLDVSAYPELHKKYDSLQTPAIVTLTKGLFGRKTKSYGERIRPADLRAHVDYLLDLGPEPVDAFDDTPPEPAKPSGKGAQHISDRDFNRLVLKSKKPVFVDFWAAWCGPCRSIAPFIDQMAQEYAGRVQIVKLNTEENRLTPAKFQIQSIPTFITYLDGEVFERRSGASPQLIRDMLEEVLLAGKEE